MPRRNKNRSNGGKKNGRGRGRKTGQNNGGMGSSQSIMKQPRYYPIVTYKRTATRLFDINCDGINPSLGEFLFTLDQLPAYQDFTNLYQSYRLVRAKVTWRPEYTELTDASLVSNAVNVTFNTAIDQTDPNPPATVDQVLEYQNCVSTGITKTHSRSLRPTILMPNGMVCSECFITTTQPSERHYGIKYAIPPTGVAMVFRSTLVMKLQLSGAR